MYYKGYFCLGKIKHCVVFYFINLWGQASKYLNLYMALLQTEYISLLTKYPTK